MENYEQGKYERLKQEEALKLESIRRVGGARYQAFVLAGYHEYACGAMLKSADTLLQKCIRDKEGNRLYFINVWCYDWTKYSNHSLPDNKFSIQPDVQFDAHGDKTFDVTLHNAYAGVGEIEAFFEKVYLAMGCEPYEKVGG